MKITNLINDYLDDVAMFKAEGTYDCYQCCLNLINKFFISQGITDTSAITKNVLKDYVKYSQTQKISNESINKRIKVLRTCFHASGIINDDLERFPKLRVADKRFNCLNQEELNILLEHLETGRLTHKNRAIIGILLYTGCRLSELINIKFKNINLNNNSILLEHTKSNRQRYVLFTSTCYEKYLKPYLDMNNFQPEDKIFFAKKNAIECVFKRIREKLGFTKFSPHVLRHTFATTLVHNNANLDLIANLLGHSDLQITRRYLHQDVANTQKLYNQYFNFGV